MHFCLSPRISHTQIKKETVESSTSVLSIDKSNNSPNDQHSPFSVVSANPASTRRSSSSSSREAAVIQILVLIKLRPERGNGVANWRRYLRYCRVDRGLHDQLSIVWRSTECRLKLIITC